MHDTGVIDLETQKPEIILDYNATKGGVDTVDQMCGTYAVKRISRRWPLIIFFSIMDMAGINAQILFNSNLNNPNYPRRIFLKNLSLALMKPYLEERANLKCLPQDIQVSLAKYRKVEDPVTQRVQRKKVGRCTLCGRSKNINTTSRCSICDNFVCKQHSIKKVVCKSCDQK